MKVCDGSAMRSSYRIGSRPPISSADIKTVILSFVSFSLRKKSRQRMRIQASAVPLRARLPDWGGCGEESGWISTLTAWHSFPCCHKSPPISSESQAWLAAGRPAGAAGPTRELLSVWAQMAVQLHTPDTSTDEEREGGQGRTRWKGEELVEETVGKKVHSKRKGGLRYSDTSSRVQGEMFARARLRAEMSSAPLHYSVQTWK